MKHWRLIALFTLSVLTAAFLFYKTMNPELKETIIYFPVDETLTFVQAETLLSLLDEKDEDEYVLHWKLASQTNRETYLRQDIGLLYSDGRLISTLGKWKENTQEINLKDKIKGEDSSHFSAISLHHAESHYPDDIIKGQQKMSYDQLYVIDSPLQPLESFRTPATAEEKDWKETLDRATAQALKYSWSRLIDTYQIPAQQYELIPLTSLHHYNDKPLPNKTLEQSQRIIGQLWEGLYKNYYLGIKKEDGTTVDPIGSAIPLILLGENHLIVLIEDVNGAPSQLVQYF